MKLYGTLDLLFAGLYGYVGFVLAPGRSTWFNAGLGLVCALLVVGGLGLLAGQRWARPVAIAASGVLLAFSAAVLCALVASAAYLRGIYGTLGLGMAAVCLAIAALVVEGFALLPLFQLRFLLGRGGKAAAKSA